VDCSGGDATFAQLTSPTWYRRGRHGQRHHHGGAAAAKAGADMIATLEFATQNIR
jgi:hypothetical protein